MSSYLYLFFFFFFQAEDGIRDLTVTGVQTCALPIYTLHILTRERSGRGRLLDRDDFFKPSFHRQRERDASATRPDIRNKSGRTTRQHELDEPLRFRTGNQRARIYREVERPEPHTTDRVRERHTAFELRHGVLKPGGRIRRPRLVAPQPGFSRRRAGYGCPDLVSRLIQAPSPAPVSRRRRRRS